MKATEKELNKYTPAYEPVSFREPSEAEKRLDVSLKAYMDKEMKLESDEEMVRRDSVLAEVRNIFIDWVKYVATEVLHMPEEEAEDAGGELFISGSHRLGVRDVGADIDTVCVAPNFCTRDHFFTYLKDDLLRRSEVTELNAVEDAFVPIISFDYRGVSIDLLFARLAENSVAKDIDILDDDILRGLDEATEKSLNGPRVTNMIFKLVGEKTFPNFLIVLRCIRKWAKRRGLYGNKLGYLGGVNFNIMVAFICQLYPNSSPSTLLFRFFKQYKDWKWPEPVMLNNIQPNPPGALITEERQVWSQANSPKDVMPLITPAYPAMNSAFNVSSHTFAVIAQEIHRGFEITSEIIKDKNWERLFEPSDFFIKYPHYLACHLVGTGENAESRSWIGFVESRIRRLIQYPYLETLPVSHPIQLFPIVSKTKKSDYSICYFIGFNLDLDLLRVMETKDVHIDECVARFQESLWDTERGFRGERVEGLDFYVEHLTWRRLPKEVFETLGGFDAAKAKRQEMGYGAAPAAKRKTDAIEEAGGENEKDGFKQETSSNKDLTELDPSDTAVNETKSTDRKLSLRENAGGVSLQILRNLGLATRFATSTNVTTIAEWRRRSRTSFSRVRFGSQTTAALKQDPTLTGKEKKANVTENKKMKMSPLLLKPLSAPRNGVKKPPVVPKVTWQMLENK